jgi:hypothetical protein
MARTQVKSHCGSEAALGSLLMLIDASLQKAAIAPVGALAMHGQAECSDMEALGRKHIHAMHAALCRTLIKVLDAELQTSAHG